MAQAGSLPDPHLETQSFFIAFLPGLFSNKKREASASLFSYISMPPKPQIRPRPIRRLPAPSSAFSLYRMESSRIGSPSIFLMVNTPSS